jgi:iron-sulfur cluster assembly protein
MQMPDSCSIIRTEGSGSDVITVTDSAAEKLREMMAGRGEDESALRIYVKPGGCSGFSYGMALDGPKESDLQYNINGILVLVDKESLALIDGSEVDYVDDFTGQGFRILNPNATSTCGCGSSFRTATQAGQPGSCDV